MKRMMKSRYVVVCCLLLLQAAVVCAQQDTLRRADAQNTLGIEEDLSGLDTTGFDARKYLNQKRYTPENTSFMKKEKHWTDHLFVNLSGGFLWMDRSSSTHRLKDGSQGHLFIGKEFTSIHGARLGVGFNQFMEQTSRQDQMNYELRADYLCNFSSILFGYNPKRWLDVTGVVGMSYFKCDFNGMKDNAYGANLGLQFLLKAGSSTAVTIEPGMTFLTDGYDMAYDNNRHNGNLSYGVKFGLKYLFTDENLSWPKDPDSYWTKNTFAELSMGLNGCNNDNFSIGRSWGYKYTGSVGKWMTPGVGIRIGATAATNRWKESVTYVNISNEERKGYVREEMQAHVGGRIEAVINPLGFGDPQKFNRYAPFAVNLSVGGEAGWMVKSDFTEDNRKESVKCGYLGLTGGVQLLYQVQRDIAFFLEPRVTFLSYDIPYENRPELSKDYTDNVYSFNVGIRVNAPTKKDRDSLKLMQKHHPFTPGFYASAEGGVYNFLQSRRFKDATAKVGLTAGVAGGYRFSRYLGARMSVAYGNYTINNLYNYTEYYVFEDKTYPLHYRGLWERKLKQLTVNADLEVNLTNLYMGYDTKRMVDVSLLIGPSFSAIMGSSDTPSSRELVVGERPSIDGESVDGTTFGASAGFIVSARVNKQVQVYLLPRIAVYPEEFLAGHSVTAYGWTEMLSTVIGASWNF